jgi:AcrR family transcriptional regulator
MNPQHPPENPESIRSQILDAAEDRFREFGYNKTTMAEIAGDCQMSAANLYRYFDNKLDIGAGLACRCFAEEHQLLSEVAGRPGLSSSQRLETFVLSSLRRIQRMCEEKPRFNEMVEAVATQRQDVVMQRMDSKQRLLVSILEQGNASGEFDVPDTTGTAEAIRAAITLFDVPLFVPMYPPDEMERTARNVTTLLLRGLLKRHG